MSERLFERAYSKTMNFQEDFEYGPIFDQDYQLIEEILDYEPVFLYNIDYEFSCDVDVFGRVATNKIGIGSIQVTCVDLGIANREHEYSDLTIKETKAAMRINSLVNRRIEDKYAYGIHL
jgi:hypothetical protein